MVGKSPLRLVQLGRGHAQVQQRPIQGRRTSLGQQRLCIVKIAVNRMEAGILLQPRRSGGDGILVPVNAIEGCRAARGFQHRPAMSAAAQGSVCVNAVFPDVHPLEHFRQQHRFVDECHGTPSFFS